MDANEFNRDRTIDPSQLDVEAIQQADLFFKWSKRAIEARFEVDRLKLKSDAIEARLQLECREHPKRFDLANVTEASVKAAVGCSKKNTKAKRCLNRARAVSAMMDQAVKAMEIKKRMIEVLITLHGQQYFAGPSVPRNIIEAWQEHTAEAEQTINSKTRSKTRPRKKKKQRSNSDD